VEIEQSDGSLKSIMQIVADRTRRITSARGAAIGLIDDDGDSLVYHSISGYAESYLGDTFDLSCSPSGICLREGKPLHAADTEADPRVSATKCRAVSVRSLLIVPILHKNVKIGVITVVDSRPHAFDEWDVNTLELMAGTIGAAISQALAGELAERRARGRADALEQLRRSEERFRAATEGSLDAFLILAWVRDASDVIVDFECVDANARAETLLSKPRSEIVGKTVAAVLGKRDADRLKPVFLRAINAGATIEHEQRIRIRGVKAQWIRYQIVPITDGIAVTCRDITERRTSERLQSRQLARIREVNAELQRERAALEEANAKLELLARMDGLTAVYNHRGFREILDQEYWRCVRYNRPLSVVVLDLDKFKPYNDAFGHPAGDEALRYVAEILKSAARESDFVARTGGEEFVVVLPHTSTRGAIASAERFRQALSTADWQLRTITASFGVASLTVVTRDSQELVTQADRALYASKRRGGNCVTHADELDATPRSAVS
jgi:diguanylate cyclase (GGDEF)-like protein/PAS domain S-box-containing protein